MLKAYYKPASRPFARIVQTVGAVGTLSSYPHQTVSRTVYKRPKLPASRSGAAFESPGWESCGKIQLRIISWANHMITWNWQLHEGVKIVPIQTFVASGSLSEGSSERLGKFLTTSLIASVILQCLMLSKQRRIKSAALIKPFHLEHLPFAAWGILLISSTNVNKNIFKKLTSTLCSTETEPFSDSSLKLVDLFCLLNRCTTAASFCCDSCGVSSSGLTGRSQTPSTLKWYQDAKYQVLSNVT